MVAIDVYEHPFPKDVGYCIYESEKARLLLLRMEDLATCGPPAFKRFLNLDDFELAQSNVSERKTYSGLYQRFLKEVRIPGSYIDRMYESKMAMHFYSRDELESFRSRWTRC